MQPGRSAHEGGAVVRRGRRADRGGAGPRAWPRRGRLRRGGLRRVRLGRDRLVRRATAARGARARAGRDDHCGRGRRERTPYRHAGGDPPPRTVRRVPPVPARPRDAVRALSRHASGSRGIRRASADLARSWSPSCSSCPESLDALDGTFVEPLACVLRAQDRAGLRPGDALLVVGAGVNGLLQIAAAHVRGVEAVWVARTAARAARAGRAAGRRAPRQRARRRGDGVHAQARRDRRRAPALAPGGTLCLYAPPAPGAPLPVRRRGRCSCASWPSPPATRPGPATCGPRSADRERVDRPGAAGLASLAAGRDGPGARPSAPAGGAQGRGGAVRAAILFGPGDLRVQEVTRSRTATCRGGPRSDDLRYRREDVALRASGAAAVPVRVRPRDRRRARPTPASACWCRTRWRARAARRAARDARRSAGLGRGCSAGSPSGSPLPRRPCTRPRGPAGGGCGDGRAARRRAPCRRRAGPRPSDVGILGGGPMGLMLDRAAGGAGTGRHRRRPSSRSVAPRRETRRERGRGA